MKLIEQVIEVDRGFLERIHVWSEEVGEVDDQIDSIERIYKSHPISTFIPPISPPTEANVTVDLQLRYTSMAGPFTQTFDEHLSLDRSTPEERQRVGKGGYEDLRVRSRIHWRGSIVGWRDWMGGSWKRCSVEDRRGVSLARGVGTEWWRRRGWWVVHDDDEDTKG